MREECETRRSRERLGRDDSGTMMTKGADGRTMKGRIHIETMERQEKNEKEVRNQSERNEPDEIDERY